MIDDPFVWISGLFAPAAVAVAVAVRPRRLEGSSLSLGLLPKAQKQKK
jgi:hypothetical protein